MVEKTTLYAEYISRINRTFDYIESNIEKPMTLGELASIANFSRFHFNRIFQSVVGETPFQFILRVRLEKAATLILTNKSENISDIAHNCGFSDISVFSRNFKSYFQISASQYRLKKSQKSNLSQQDSNRRQSDEKPTPYFCPELKTINWTTNMKLNKGVEVRELPKMTVAYIRNMGPWGGDKNEYEKLRDKLFSWAEARDLIFGKDFKYFILYHDDPNVALSDKLRMSLCITVPPETKVNGEIGKMEVEGGKYATARFELTGQDFQDAWEWLYGQWLPNSGYKLDDKPYFETYPEAPKGEKFIVDFCIPVKSF
jgi:AraC family transcriptional regulator